MTDINAMQIRMGKMAAEIERLQSVIDEANAQESCGYQIFSSVHGWVTADEDTFRLRMIDKFAPARKIYAHPIPAQQSQYGFSAQDMATASADGFRAGQQSPAVADSPIRGNTVSGPTTLRVDGLCEVTCDTSQSPAVVVRELKDIEVTDQMASAFNQAICDDSMNDQDIEEVKTGLRAAISHLHPMPKSFYELEIERLVAINNSLLANERRLIERLRTIQSSPRITEQDAREMATQFFYWWHNQPGTNTMQGFGEWINGEGRALLNKLNGDKNGA